MPDPNTQKLTIAEYNEAKLKLSELMKNAVTGFAAAQKAGDLDKAKAWSETLVQPIASLKEQFLQLSPRDQFVSKYSVEKINAHQVRFIIPKGTSRIELINEAQGIGPGLYWREAVYHYQLKKWQKEDDFTSKTTSTNKLGIDGRVKGLDAKSREEQERLLGKMAPLADLAVAHATFFILTGKDLFQSQWVRACGGALRFNSYGLAVYSFGNDGSIIDVSASRSLPSTN